MKVDKSVRCGVLRPVPEGRVELPSRGKQLLESPWQWLADKKKVDSEAVGIPEKLWAVRGKLYDLSAFVDKHPGGKEWLELTKGSDVTDFYETHHLDEAKTDAILKKYYVRDAAHPSITRFTYDENDFYKTLKNRVFAHFTKNSLELCRLTLTLSEIGGARVGDFKTAPTTEMYLTCCFAVSSFFICFYYMCTVQSFWTAILLAMIAGECLHALMGVGHNFFHQRNSPWMYCFDFTLFSSHQWRISHALSHHNYANLELDMEISSLEPYLYMLSNKPRNSPLIYVTFHIILLLASTLDWIRHWVSVSMKKEKARPENIIPFIELLFLVLSRGTKDAVISFAVHRHEKIWTEGDENPRMDFGRHVLCSTTDHSFGLPLLFSLYGFAWLNYHNLHHLFPTIDHSRLHEAEKIFVDTCKEFGIPLKREKFPELIISVFRRHDMFTSK